MFKINIIFIPNIAVLLIRLCGFKNSCASC